MTWTFCDGRSNTCTETQMRNYPNEQERDFHVELLSFHNWKEILDGHYGPHLGGFVLAHMAINLLIFVKRRCLQFLRSSLNQWQLYLRCRSRFDLTFLVHHVACAVSLTIQNRKAKASKYAVGSALKQKRFPRKLRAWWLFRDLLSWFFVVSHILTFKFGTYYETTVDGVVV